MGNFMNGNEFDLRYDMIVLDDNEIWMNNFDNGTMNHNGIDIWCFFTLRFASSFGKMLYVRNNSNDTNKEMHVLNDLATYGNHLNNV